MFLKRNFAKPIKTKRGFPSSLGDGPHPCSCSCCCSTVEVHQARHSGPAASHQLQQCARSMCQCASAPVCFGLWSKPPRYATSP